MSDLTNEEVFSLIKRGFKLKNGKQVSQEACARIKLIF